MSAANFDSALALELSYEGGFVSNPRDPGGPTNMGVTLATLSAFRGHSCCEADVRRLTRADVTPIYRGIWDAISADSLPSGVDLVLFDGAVNQGPAAAARMLQRAVGVLVDAQIGAKTLYAVAAIPPGDLIERIRRQRLAAYQASGGWPTFGTGWSRRLNAVAQTATAWAVKGARAARAAASQTVEIDL